MKLRSPKKSVIFLPHSSERDDEPASTTTAAKLFKQHALRITRFLGYRLRNHADGQDAAQEVFLRLWKREHEGALRDEASSYMGSVVNSVAIDMDRVRHTHAADRHVDIDSVEIAGGGACNDETQFWREGVVSLAHALSDLPDLTQKIFILYYVEGMTHEEIARELGMSVRTIERHMVRAMSFCTPRMKDFIG